MGKDAREFTAHVLRFSSVGVILGSVWMPAGNAVLFLSFALILAYTSMAVDHFK